MRFSAEQRKTVAAAAKPWTAAEDDVILTNYVTTSFSEIAAMLPGRTRNGVAGRCQRLRLSKQPEKGRRTVAYAVPHVSAAEE